MKDMLFSFLSSRNREHIPVSHGVRAFQSRRDASRSTDQAHTRLRHRYRAVHRCTTSHRQLSSDRCSIVIVRILFCSIPPSSKRSKGFCSLHKVDLYECSGHSQYSLSSTKGGRPPPRRIIAFMFARRGGLPARTDCSIFPDSLADRRLLRRCGEYATRDYGSRFVAALARTCKEKSARASGGHY